MPRLLLLLLALIPSACSTSSSGGLGPSLGQVVDVRTTGSAVVRTDFDALFAGGTGQTTVDLIGKRTALSIEFLRLDAGRFVYRNGDVDHDQTYELVDGVVRLPWHAARLFPGAQANQPLELVPGLVSVVIAPPLP